MAATGGARGRRARGLQGHVTSWPEFGVTENTQHQLRIKEQDQTSPLVLGVPHRRRVWNKQAGQMGIAAEVSGTGGWSQGEAHSTFQSAPKADAESRPSRAKVTAHTSRGLQFSPLGLYCSYTLRPTSPKIPQRTGCRLRRQLRTAPVPENSGFQSKSYHSPARDVRQVKNRPNLRSLGGSVG